MKKKLFTTIHAKRVSHPVLLLALVLNLVLLSGQGRAQSFSWVRQVTGKYSNPQLLVLPNGDYFVAGIHTGDLTIGSFLNCGAGGSDVFVAYFKGSTGEPYWVKRIAGPQNDEIGDLSYADEYLYITGSFRGKATVDNFRTNAPDDPDPCFSFLSETIESAGESDIFLVRYYAPTGSLACAARAGGPGIDKGTGVKSIGQSENGHVVLSGYFTKEASFHSIDANDQPSTTTTIQGAGVHRDAFLADYQLGKDAKNFTTLNLKWTQRVGVGQGDNYSEAVDVDNTGFIYLTGGFTLNLGFFSNLDQTWTWLNTPAPQGSSNSDIFVAKYSLSGALVWANQAGGTGWDASRDVVVDAAGNAYVAGSYQSNNTIFYRNLPQGRIALIKPVDGGSFDGFLAKYKPNGVVEWVNTLSGEQSESLSGVAKAPNGDIVAAGHFTGNVKSFFTGGQQSLVSTGGANNRDAVVLQYQPDGKMRWKLVGGGAAINTVESMGVSSAGEVYIAGSQTGQGHYGPIQLPADGDFIVKINPPLGISARLESAGAEQGRPEATDLAGLVAYPVPTAEQVTCAFTATAKEFASLVLFDARGEIKATLFQGETQVGKRYQFVLHVGQYSPGIYIVKLTSLSRSLHTKIVVAL